MFFFSKMKIDTLKKSSKIILHNVLTFYNSGVIELFNSLIEFKSIKFMASIHIKSQ